MRLKTLEIKGFKSFADQTVINFEEDVIGIVGPNGSGKSNIVDAFRWVLGEQSSRELRLDQMSSVIFNGSKDRKPCGVAQVTLNFENNAKLLPIEYQSVSISRLLYRSGESEYRLNGVTCRLKDITNLFIDSGIGSDSYAIIALSMVDEILADKDNARRKMFEQAAGVSKYKLRKRETLSRLDSTTADLERVEDLLFEISNNLKSLEQQARRTKRYFELKEDHKQQSIKLATFKSEALKIQYKDINNKLNAEEDNYRQVDVEVTKKEAQLEALRKANLDQEIALTSRQKEVNQLGGLIRDKENEQKVLEQRILFIEQNKSKAVEQIGLSKLQIGTLEHEIEEYRTNLNEEKVLERRLEKELEEAERKLNSIRQNHSEIKSGLDEEMMAQQQVEKALFELEKQKAVNTNQIDSSTIEIQRHREEIYNRQNESSSLSTRLQELEKQETQLSEKLKAIEESEELRTKKMLEKEKDLEELKLRIQKIQRELDSKRNEYKLTKSMVDSLEGFPESIRFLSTEKSWSQNAPLLSDLIYVDADYRVAIENYLEPYLNFYVVENIAEARAAVQLLHSAQKGKANFFILEAFKDYTPKIALFPPEAKPATELIQCDARYRNLLNHLLDNVIIAEKDEWAQSVDTDTLTIIAKSGRFIQKKYSFSGGSIGLFEGKKIGRKKNLEVLEKSISKSENEENKLSSQMYNLKGELESLKVNHSRAEIKGAQVMLNQLIQEKVSLSARKESFDLYNREMSVKIDQLEARIVELQSANLTIESQLNEKMAQAQSARENISSKDGSYRQIAEELSQASAAYNQNNIEFIKQQNRVGGLQRELSYRAKRREETLSAIANFEKTVAQAGDEIAGINDQIQSTSEELVKAYAQRKELEGSLSASEQSFFAARGEINEAENVIRQLNKKSHDLQVLINSLKDKFTDTKYQLASIAQRLKIEFGMDINDADALSLDPSEKEKIDETELEMKVERMKSRLENYGEINPMAVEAYDEMKERHDTISSQRDDIHKAKHDLIETIREIEETATSQFLEAFSKVRQYFIDVFRKLFTSDDAADLLLINPENPLESGIEIVAKPKGKKPQTISQLSGGEKTLTSTALLFALYLLKPAPFCIFDEVDAPLDDANIQKFNNIIREFSGQSQFIIVTHNKQTMAAVESIYGVYMAEKGVSSVAQVSFKELTYEPQLENIEN